MRVDSYLRSERTPSEEQQMNLPSPIHAYFAADERGDGGALILAFAADAIVKDEGRTYAGHHAISAWWRETKDKYQTAIEPLEVGRDGEVTTVRASVTGQFPGSPAVLSFMFRLDGDRISRLDIEA
jgi:hypothetical protein